MGASSLHFVHVMPTSNSVEDDSSLSLEEQRIVRAGDCHSRAHIQDEHRHRRRLLQYRRRSPALLAARRHEHEYRLSRASFALLQSFRVSRGVNEQSDVIADLKVESFAFRSREVRRSGRSAVAEHKGRAGSVARTIANTRCQHRLAVYVLSAKLRQNPVAQALELGASLECAARRRFDLVLVDR